MRGYREKNRRNHVWEVRNELLDTRWHDRNGDVVGIYVNGLSVAAVGKDRGMAREREAVMIELMIGFVGTLSAFWVCATVLCKREEKRLEAAGVVKAARKVTTLKVMKTMLALAELAEWEDGGEVVEYPLVNDDDATQFTTERGE
jgi:hypothetical protein